MMFFHQRKDIINLLKDGESPEKERPKILVDLAHITSIEEAHNSANKDKLNL